VQSPCHLGFLEDRHHGVQLTVVACDVEARRPDEGTQGGVGEECLVRKVSNRVAINPKSQMVRYGKKKVGKGGPYGKTAPTRGGKKVARRDHKWAPDRSGSDSWSPWSPVIHLHVKPQVSDGRSPKSPWAHVSHHNGDLDETDAFELH
jgi:hypothetical protein